jgi:hypothetical protein
MPAEKVKLRIGSLARAVLITGQAYQDPKDALNEFVSNAADEYVVLGRRGERIRIILRRKGRYPVVAIDDEGRGMSPERLREVARNLFKSEKIEDDRTLGEKAIGLLAFQQLGGRCEIVSRAEGSAETWALRLHRGEATAELVRERRRARSSAGTTVYLSDLDPEVLRTITQRKVTDYLRRRRGPAIERGDYVIEVHEGRTVEMVTPEPLEGIKVPLAPQRTLWGTIEFNLFVAPAGPVRRTVAVVGRANTGVIDDIAELDEFTGEPWAGGQVTGWVAFPGLQQTAGRRAVLRDRDAYPLFVDAVRGVEPVIRRVIERVNAQVDAATADRLSSTLRKVFGHVLKELADLDNPMRTMAGDEPGEGGLLEVVNPRRPLEGETPSLEAMTAHAARSIPGPFDVETLADDGEPDEPVTAVPARAGSRRLPSIASDPDPGEARSRFDADLGVVFYNDRHTDYLLVKDTEALLLDYLATLIAKEYVVYNNPLSPPTELAEELVRMLVRVRRHLPRTRRA